MSYIGNQPTYAAFVTDQFSGNGGVTFTMSVAPANTASVLVAVSGVLQDPSTYSVSGLTLTFSQAPPVATANISVRYMGIPASGITNTAYRTVTEFTATSGQTSFSIPSYTVGFINVYRNGVRLGALDFTATSGTSVTLANGAFVGDLVTTESFYVSSVLNAIPATAGAVNTAYIADNAITSAKIAAGAVTQVNLTANVAGNGPAFSAYLSSNQSITNATFTKVQLNTEVFDTNSNFDNSTNYRFTPTVAGYYQVSFSITANTSTSPTRVFSNIYKNGSMYTSGSDYTPLAGGTNSNGSVLVYLNGSTDYIELYAYITAAVASVGGGSITYMTGALVRAA